MPAKSWLTQAPEKLLVRTWWLPLGAAFFIFYRNKIDPSLKKRVTTTKAKQRHNEPLKNTMAEQGLFHVLGTSGIKSAARQHAWANV